MLVIHLFADIWAALGKITALMGKDKKYAWQAFEEMTRQNQVPFSLSI